MEEERVYINWGDILCKILFLVAFALILLWLYPKNNLSPFYDRIFNENIQTMKEAAKDYFTVDRLPSKDNSTTKITLNDMLDAKMILEFRDKDGNTCDPRNSYVEARRISDDEYELKVLLTCGNTSDYIIDTIGCYDVCEGKECESSTIDIPSNDDSTSHDGTSVDIDESSSVEYEFKRSINKMDYSCDSGYTLSGSHCYRTSVLDRTSATLVQSGTTTKVTDAKKTNGSTNTIYDDPKVTTTYVCGSEYDNAGTYNVPTTCKKTNVHTAASVKQTYYICSSEYINAGTYNVPTVCYKNAETKVDATKVTKYVCSSNYDNAGTYNSPTTCSKVTTATATSQTTTKYTCSSGYDNAGTYNSPTTCSKTTTAAATSQTTTTPGSYSEWSCGSCSTRAFTGPKSNDSTTKYESKGTATKYVCGDSYCPGYITVYYYVVYTRSYNQGSTVTKYVCSSSYDNAGTYDSPTTCKKTTTAAATSSSTTTYTCSSSYDNAGTYSVPTTCKKTTTAAATITNSYVCSSEYNNAGTYNVPTTCVKTSTSGVAAVQNDKYTCDASYDNAGTYTTNVTCRRTVVDTGDATANNTYTCASGFTKVGEGENTICKKTVTTPGEYYCSDASAELKGTKCYKTIPGSSRYTCPSGYTLSGKTCIKYQKETIEAHVTCTVDHYEYKWSSELTLDGWGRTGKYRVTAYNSNLEQEPGCVGACCNNLLITCPEVIDDDDDCDCSK